MLKNMRVGTKLVAILVAPLVALAMLAGVGVVDRLSNASDARRAGRLGVLANRDAEAVQALELEQLWATALTGRATGEARATYQDLVTQSDAALAQLDAAAERVGHVEGDLADRLGTVDDRVATLAPLRSGVLSGGAAPADAFNGYHPVVEALVGVLDGAATQPVAPGINAYLGFMSTLARGKSAVADEYTHLVDAATKGGTPDPATLSAASDAASEASRRYATFFEQADTEFKALLRNAQASSGARTADDMSQQLLSSSATRPADEVDAAKLLGAVTQRLQAELDVEREITTSLLQQADAAEANANSTVRLYLLGASLGILASLALAFLVARATARPLRQLTTAANQLAGDQLPRLVERLRNPDADPVELSTIPIDSRDEIGQLARAFNDIQRVTADVAEEQASLLRKGISDIFVNLARRNQALLDRQIAFIDQLESNEADPDQLENLFRLDHLATRMRRNAESLLVLAGAEPSRRRGRPVALADVVRVAIGEVEDFARVNLLALDDVTVAANVAVDLSHVVAELMDNATQFSPPETLVEVVGHRTREGSYVLSVSDQGIGMSPEQFAEANQQLAHPPVMGLSLGRSLGFVVIGRLAARHGVSVRLAQSPSGGVTALVTIPAELLGQGAGGYAAPEPELAAVAAPTSPATGGAPPFAPADPVAPGWANGHADDARVAGALPGRIGSPDDPVPVLVARSPFDDAGSATGSGPAVGSDSGVEAGSAVDAGSPVGPSSSVDVDSAPTGSSLVDAPVDRGEAPPPPAAPAPPAPPAPVHPTPAPGPTRRSPVSSDGGESFTYNDIGESEPVPDAVLARLLPRRASLGQEPAPQPAAPFPPGAVTRPPASEPARPSETPSPVGATAPTAIPEVDPAPPAEAPSAVEAVVPGEADPSLASSVPVAQSPPSSAPTGAAGAAAEEDPRPLTGWPTAERGWLPVAMPDPLDRGRTENGLPRRTPLGQRADGPVPALGAEPAAMPGGAAPALSGAPRNGEQVRAVDTAPPAEGLRTAEPATPTDSLAVTTPSRTGEAARGGELTAAGLVRRSPKQQIRDLAATGGSPLGGRSVGSQRSPEEVRRMLSRYRTGLQRGRQTAQQVAGTDGGDAAGNGDAPNAEEHR